MKLLSGKQMASVDKRAIEEYDIPSLQLMEQAGTQLYYAIKDMVSKDDRILIVCGSGNNGGDGYVLARLFYGEGYQVELLALETKDLSEDCRVNLDFCADLHLDFASEIGNHNVIVDAIFGTGLSRNIEGKYKDIIEKINTSDAKVISVDIPSGINSSDGKVLGVAVKADITLTLQTAKIGLYLYPGRVYSGKISVLDIGIPPILIDEVNSNIYLSDKAMMKGLLPKRSIHSNKGTYGKILCVGGSTKMSGAISMAAIAALRSGCGLLTCAIPESIRSIVATNVLESMYLPLPEKDGQITKEATTVLKEQLDNYSCVLIGCGIGRSEDIVDVLQVILDSDVPLLIDADGLYALKDLLPHYKHREHLIITPHMKEFSRLINIDVDKIVDDPIKHGLQFTAEYPNITLVLKSETSFVMQGDRVYINTYGNNGLAKGGSGDVLAGIISGLNAQKQNELESAILGMFLHAYSADLLLEEQTVYSILPSDLFKKIDVIIKGLEGDTL
ncbi:NAD(P)H-hydrate dehydratase [Breznakia pachnodae]|uniref:Bifunctional NAD(P)H-hydrate repair enzyme n=1 Tax=Breznakia pachnodae TaxID=265178 RepID=A0ABU0E330_9FIRM|nr:NAD(P)H-hydrate dehydratase [Breznakia pachnodae]MDQ0361241.1 NAD(P)H-hydrate epimerase [Breznakia pachnodae]